MLRRILCVDLFVDYILFSDHKPYASVRLCIVRPTGGIPMIAYAGLLERLAKEAGITVPEDLEFDGSNLQDFRESHPHFFVYAALQCPQRFPGKLLFPRVFFSVSQDLKKAKCPSIL